MSDRTKRILRPFLAIIVFGALSAAAHSDDDSPVQRAVDYRTSYMTILNWNARPMGKMLKGEQPFDNDSFLAHARELASASALELLAAFPEGSATEDSAALEEIWFNWKDFEQKFADFRAAAETLGEAAGGGDLEATKTAFGKVGEACKACHKKYKE